MEDTYKSSSKDPYSSDAFSSSYGDNVYGSSKKTSQVNPLQTVEGLTALANANGIEKNTPLVLNAVDKVGRALNWDVAQISGMALGLLRDNMSIMEGRKYGLVHNTGYENVLEEVFGKPNTTAGKVAMGTVGFAADVFLSPLTYLTLGYGGAAKVAGKATFQVTRAGEKLLNKGSKEIISHAESLAAEGLDQVTANKWAQTIAKKDIDTFYEKSLVGAKKGELKPSDFEELIKKGLSSKTVEHLMQLSGKIIDEGGLKMFGKTLITSEALSKTALGRAANKLGEFSVIQTLTNTFGKMFIHDFQKNPVFARIVESANVEKKRAFSTLAHEVNDIVSPLSEAEQVKLAETGHSAMMDVLAREREIKEKLISQIEAKFPEYRGKLGDKEYVRKIYNELDDAAVDAYSATVKKIEEITAPTLRKENAKVLKSGGIDLGTERTKLDELLFQLDSVNKTLKGQLDTGERISRKKTIVGHNSLEPEITDVEREVAKNNILKREYQRVSDEVAEAYEKMRKYRESAPGTYHGGDSYSPDRYNRVKTSNGIEATTKKNPKKKLSDIDMIVILERKLKKIQSDLSAKDELFKGMMGARRAAKAEQRTKKIEFKDSPRMQTAADRLWNNADSFTSKLAKIANMQEEDVFKFYFPSTFESKVTVKKAQIGRNSSIFSAAKDDHLKMFSGAEDYIKNAGEAYKKTALELVSSKVKSNAMKSVFKSFGIQAAGRSDKELTRLGFVKLDRDILNEKLSGWIPKEMKDEMDKMFQPSKSIIDEIARNTGFDWATSLMKSWSTAFFPAFQFLNLTSNQVQLMIGMGAGVLDPSIQKNMTHMAVLGLPDHSVFKKAYTLFNRLDAKEFDSKFFVTNDGKKITYKEFGDQIKEHSDILDEGIFNDFEHAIKTVGEKTNWNPASLNFTVLEQARLFGQSGEVQAKLVAIQHGIMRGHSIESAIKEAEKTIFNYQKLTPFEKEYMRRIIPFYTFGRKNLELQANMLARHPGRVATQFKLANNINSAYGEDQRINDETGLPQYVLNRIGIRAGVNKNGQPEVLSGFGLPIEEFLSRFSGDKGFIWNTVSNVLTQSNPIIKYPLERITGVDLFRGRPIVELDNGEKFKGMIDALGGPNKGAGKQLAELISFREVPNQPKYVNGVRAGTYTKYVADPIFMHFLRNIPTARLQNTIDKLTSEDTTEDDRIINFITGFQKSTIDEQKEKFFKELKIKDDLTYQLERIGVLNSKEIFYDPTKLKQK